MTFRPISEVIKCNPSDAEVRAEWTGERFDRDPAKVIAELGPRAFNAHNAPRKAFGKKVR